MPEIRNIWVVRAFALALFLALTFAGAEVPQ